MLVSLDQMLEPAALNQLTSLAALQRRHSGAVILLSSNRTRAWPDVAPNVKVPVDRTLLRRLESEGLVMVEPYIEAKPRGTQILGMTSQGWRLAEGLTRPGPAPQRAA